MWWTTCSISHPTCEGVTGDLVPHGFSGTVRSMGQSEDAASLVAAEVALVSGHKQSCDSITLVGMPAVCQVATSWGEIWESKIPLQSMSLLLTAASRTSLVAHLQDLTSAWLGTEEEIVLHTL